MLACTRVSRPPPRARSKVRIGRDDRLGHVGLLRGERLGQAVEAAAPTPLVVPPRLDGGEQLVGDDDLGGAPVALELHGDERLSQPSFLPARLPAGKVAGYTEPP